MALQGPFPVEFGLVFPSGVYAAGGFEKVRDFDQSKRGEVIQQADKATGLPLWVVEVIDADPEARQRTVKVKVAAEYIAIRGTIARSELRRVLAATYHQVWWPDAPVRYHDGDQLAVWDDQAGRYVDPATGEVLPDRDEALDAIGPYDLPWHVARYGDRFDAQGVLAGSPQAARCISYLTKYLTKQIGTCHTAATGPDHAARLAEALRYQPCSPRCANWLRYGIQPKSARPGQAPGACKGKAHDGDHLGYAGRPVLVSRKWSGNRSGRPPRRPQGMAAADPRRSGNRPGPVRLGAGRPGRPRPHGPRPADAARRRRPAPMADRTGRGQAQGRDAAGR